MRAEGCTDRRVGELLPWYVNETLTGEERSRVAEHVAQCASCRDEVELLRGVSVALRVEAPALQTDLLARTLERLRPARRPGLLARVRQALPPVPPWAGLVLAGQLAAIVVLAGMLLLRPATMTTLSGGSGQPGPAVRLQVVFADGATVAEMRALLAPLHARTVAGPTPTGVYELEVPLGQPPGPATPDAVVRTLRASPIVQFATVLEERR